MRTAILSDIHANAFALDAVLKHAQMQGVADGDWWFLGDAVGYGPHPVEALEFWQRLQASCSVPGNHDATLLGVLIEETVNDQARQSHELNRRQLETRPELVQWLKSFFQAPSEWVQRQFVDDDVFILVHAALYRSRGAEKALANDLNRILPKDHHVSPADLSPLHHLGFYMWPWLTEREFLLELEAVSLLRGVTTSHACVFSGHTHIPQFWFLDGVLDGETKAIRRPMRYEEPFVLSTNPTLVNPGSVGQPRDGDPRASYIILDTEVDTVTFYRVPYPVERTVRDMNRQNFPVSLRKRLHDASRPDQWPAGMQI